MNIVHAGETYQIYGEALKTYSRLPAMTYQVGFSKMTGFFLTAHPDLTVIEEKVYGNHEKKADKVLNAFKNVNRNFGVILSGQKGIGKSLFARVLARKSLALGYPLIIVDQYIPGIANFIASIDQEVLVLFDEFEKSFGKCGENERDPQEEMLSLFDGVNGGKKLFIITCNKSSDLNEFLINRPGRFHYHFAFSNPSPEEIEEYMRDNLNEEHWGEIVRVVDYATYIDVTFDYLRAIAFELNLGSSLEEALEDLNISRNDGGYYDVEVVFEDGRIERTEHLNIDMFSPKKQSFWVRLANRGSIRLDFPGNSIKVNRADKSLQLDPSKTSRFVDEDYYDEDDKEDVAALKYLKEIGIKSILFTKHSFASYKYTI